MKDYIYLLGSPKFARKFDLLKGYSQVREKRKSLMLASPTIQPLRRNSLDLGNQQFEMLVLKAAQWWSTLTTTPSLFFVHWFGYGEVNILTAALTQVG